MQLTEILRPECVKVPLKATDKYQAITELLDLLNEQGMVRDYQAALKAVMERESVRSTGIGQGFAIPHSKTEAVEQLVLAVGKLEKPIDFDSIDKEPVTMVILLLSPADQTGPHIQTLARISRMMTDKDLRPQLWAAKSAEELHHLIEQGAEQNPV